MSAPPSASVEQFEECGYTVAKDLLDPEVDLKPLYTEYSSLLDKLAGQWHAQGRLSSAYTELESGDRFAAVLREMDASCMQHFDISLPKFHITADTPIHLGPAVFNLMRNPRLLDAVASLIGSEIYSVPVQRVRIRPPQSLFSPRQFNALALPTPWHQDLSVYLPEADDSDIVSTWIPLTEVTRENGCLLLIPGSHKSRFLPHSTSSPVAAVKMGAHIQDASIDKQRAIEIPMSAGDVLFFHRKTVHAALPNLSNGIRWSIDFRYTPIGQPTGRPTFPGFVILSRQHPEQVLTDANAWAKLWLDCRQRLAATGEMQASRY